MQLIEQATLMMFLHWQGNINLPNTYMHSLTHAHTRDLSIGSCRADIIDYGTAFNLTMYLTNEEDYIVWSRVSSSVAYIRDMLSSNTAVYPKLQVRRPVAFH